MVKFLIPDPRMGGTYRRCPAVVEIIRTPVSKKSKKMIEEVVYCKFKSRNQSRYERHYRHRHGELLEPVGPTITVK